MKIYNTLTRKKEDLIVPDGAVKIYVCGSTVYNRIHLGNARPVVVFDAFRRYLLHKGMEVDYFTNFTDVDDKIIALAVEEGVDASVVSERFIAEVMTDAEGLNCLPATLYPKVTNEMPGIIEMIGKIIEKGYAYEAGGTVYFDTAAKADYGKLSGRNIDDMEAGARVEVDMRKKKPSDFVLWKPAKPGEPFWESPWGNGRPGWHIECSQMIKKYAGDTLDIHAGGSDLIFPHHENEIAQSEAANGVPLARYWMHNGMINTDNEKMSKSEGNFFMVRELSEAYGYDALRFYILSFHYRSPFNFAPEHVAEAKAAVNRLYNCVNMLENREETDAEHQHRERFYAALDDDFNTAEAIGVMFAYVKYANTNPQKASSGILLEMCGVLGLERKQNANISEDEINVVLAERAEARKNKEWKRSDELRDMLKAKGVAVKDTADGQKWSYETD
ncbi:MAG: cysteine--tRNA ligase [Defluviitaleaceae bacterium]|nr:cysteine--tRNA ligase [Defluviitaleaceae bacterium]MCL2837430.1 cysteine--tRNA ligase [Defluviitaleaceae bacterium]